MAKRTPAPFDLPLAPPAPRETPAGPVTFTVWGEAQTKGSARAFVVPVRGSLAPQGGPKYRAVVTNDNPRAKSWQGALSAAAVAAAGGRFFGPGVPVVLVVTFHLLRPASVSAKKRPLPAGRPDIDKMLRVVLDSMQQVLYHDDSQVCRVTVEKVYAAGAAFATITVGPLLPTVGTLEGL